MKPEQNGTIKRTSIKGYVPNSCTFIIAILGSIRPAGMNSRNFQMLLNLFCNWPLPTGAFQGQWNNWNELNWLRIPTGRRQTSWLCTSAAEGLYQGLPRTSPASGQISSFQVRRPNYSATLPLSIELEKPTNTMSGEAISSAECQLQWHSYFLLLGRGFNPLVSKLGSADL